MNSKGLDEEILSLIRQERNIEAIKTYRDHIGCGLKEAKEYIDSLSVNDNSYSDNIFDNELKALVASGKKLLAIKKYMDKTGAGLAEAKGYIGSLPISSTYQQQRYPERIENNTITKPIYDKANKPSHTSASNYVIIFCLILLIALAVYCLFLK